MDYGLNNIALSNPTSFVLQVLVRSSGVRTADCFLKAADCFLKAEGETVLDRRLRSLLPILASQLQPHGYFIKAGAKVFKDGEEVVTETELRRRFDLHLARTLDLLVKVCGLCCNHEKGIG
jgi:hypothetical protein